jgi:hypothetical protein
MIVETPGSRMLDPDGDIGHVEVEGHLWWLHEQVEDVTPEELAQRIADPAAHEAMSYVQGTLREEMATTHTERAAAAFDQVRALTGARWSRAPAEWGAGGGARRGALGLSRGRAGCGRPAGRPRNRRCPRW